MKDLLINQVYLIGREVIATTCPTELELFDLIWAQVKDGFKEWEETHLDRWLVSQEVEQIPGLGFLGPEAFKLSTPKILVLVTAVLTSLSTGDLQNTQEMERLIKHDVNKYGQIFSVPIHLVRHLEKTLPSLLLNIPESITEMAFCLKIVAGKEPVKITLKDARVLPKKTKEYAVFINMLSERHLWLYVDGAKLNVRRTAVKILASLLKRNGKVCSYEEILEEVWGKRRTVHIKRIPLAQLRER